MGALLKSRKELDCNVLTVLTWDYECKEDYSGVGIAFVPLWKWFLSSTEYKRITSISKLFDVFLLFLVEEIFD